jgi:phage terminase Nu1 subunit (DNA packaging protein)
MRITGQERIAEVFGVAPKTIVEWQEQGLPVALRGGPGVPSEYESEACIGWYVDREVKKVQRETPRDRLFRLQAEDLEADLLTKRGLLIPADQLEPKLAAAITAAREQLLSDAQRLAPVLVGKSATEIEAALTRSHEQFLHRIAAWRDDAEEADADAQPEELDA